MVFQEHGEIIVIKDIVVNISSEAATNFAVSVASILQAHLAGVSFLYEPIVLPITDRSAKNAKSRFDEAVRQAGLSSESAIIEAEPAEVASVFARIARRFDMSVVTQAEPNKPIVDELIVEGVLFESGRPVLVVPYVQKTGLTLNRAMVCWDGSRNAARALSDALPLLARTENVDVVTIIGERGKSDELPGADIAQHLARHGLKVELRRVALGETDVANSLLSLAADLSADFLVMGGYGHSRIREFILGGATRGILGSMTVPTLISH
jgi:nucleotide-binding universal stress UspA family protein